MYVLGAAAAGLGSTIGASIVVDFDRFQELKAVCGLYGDFSRRMLILAIGCDYMAWTVSTD